MYRFSPGLAAVVGLLLAAPASADAPKINGTVPLGVPKGIETDVTIQGTNLGNNPRLIAPFEFTLSPLPGAKNESGTWSFKLTAKPETPLGTYPIRVRTNDGLSNPFLFTVGQLAQVAEKEDNSSFESAQTIPDLVVVEGQVAGNDVDYFRFTGKKGQSIVIDAQCARIGSGVDPSIRLTTAARRYVASADDTLGLITDARLTTILPEDTDYVIEISDSRYQGEGRAVYRLVVGAIPVADEIFPIGGREGETVGFELRGGTLPNVRIAAATLSAVPGGDVARLHVTNQMLGTVPSGGPTLEVESLLPLEVGHNPEIRESSDPNAPPVRSSAPVMLNGRIDPPGDEDRFILAVTPGQVLRIEVMAAENGSALDGVLQILGPNQGVLANADDTTVSDQGGRRGRGAGIVSPDPSINFTVPAGVNEITLALRDLEARGGTAYPYRISVEPASPTFELLLNDPEASVPRNGNLLVGVTVRRNGYAGPIGLSVANPPPGLSFRPGTIAPGQNVGVLSLSAAPDASFDLTRLDIIGKGLVPPEPTVSATKDVVFAQQGPLPTNSLTQIGLPAVPAEPSIVGFELPSTPVELVHGFGTTIPVKILRQAGADAALAVTPLPLPPGLTVPPATLAEKSAEGNVTVNAAVELPLGAMTVGLIAKGKFANVERTVHLPAVTLEVVRPATLELAAPGIEIKAGTTMEVKGKVVRRGPFKDPVTVKFQGLPAGLKADPVTVPPDKSDFSAPVVADPKAAPATAGANVTLAFQVQKKDYSLPAVPLAVKVLPAQ